MDPGFRELAARAAQLQERLERAHEREVSALLRENHQLRAGLGVSRPPSKERPEAAGPGADASAWRKQLPQRTQSLRLSAEAAAAPPAEALEPSAVWAEALPEPLSPGLLRPLSRRRKQRSASGSCGLPDAGAAPPPTPQSPLASPRVSIISTDAEAMADGEVAMKAEAEAIADGEVAMKAVMGLFGGKRLVGEVVLRMVFLAWRGYVHRVRNDEVYDDDEEVEALRQKAYSLWPSLEDLAANTPTRSRSGSMLSPMPGSVLSTPASLSSESSGPSRHHGRVPPLQRLVCSPASRRRMVWDAVGFLLVLYDTAMIPMQAFELPDTDFFMVLRIATAAFWTVDFPSNFFIGYYVDGRVEMRLARVAWHYLTKWFTVDVTLVLIDWIFIGFGTDGAPGTEGADNVDVLRVGRSFRAMRVLRALRLLRLAKLFPKIWQALEDVQSDFLRMLMKVVRAVMIILTINHFVGCAWYAIGKYNYEDARTWILVEDMEGKDLDYRYGTSLHWAFCQFTPASMEVMPVNARERLFTICMVIFGLVTFSYFVSSITSSMTALQDLNVERLKQDMALRKYFDENKVSLELSKCVMDWLASNNKHHKSKVHESEILVLRDVPERLICELRQQVHLPTLAAHPFFAECRDIDGITMRKVCHNTIAEQRFLAEQDIFKRGTHAHRMYFVLTGTLSYSLPGLPEHVLVEGDWACEAALWVPWVHRGRLSAESFCELAALDIEALQGIMRKSSKALQRFIRAYAAIYVRHSCCHAEAHGCCWLTDLCCSAEVLLNMVQTAKDHATWAVANIKDMSQTLPMSPISP